MNDNIAVGVDMGGTKTLAVIYSASKGIVDHEQIATDRFAPPEKSIPEIVDIVRKITLRSGLSLENLNGVGVGVPGLVNLNRIFIDSIILPTWISVNVQELFSAELQVPIVIDNDATMAAIGHWYGSKPYVDTLLCLTLGTGVGAAAIVNRKVLRGPDGTAGQLGHITVDLSGRRCSCGGAGCLNAYVSGTAIGERYLEKVLELDQKDGQTYGKVTGKWVSTAAKNGNAIARGVIEQTSHYLGAGLASMVNIFNPEVIAISGGVSELEEILLAPARITMAQRAFRNAAQRVRIETARFGAATGAVGAAISTWNKLLL